MILFDDIGSYPLPDDVKKDWIPDAVKRRDPKFFNILRDAMYQKIDAGVDTPTYPQFQDMNQQFLGIINDESKTEEPFLIRKEDAKILELEVMEYVAEEYYKRNGERLKMRICVTGPIELYTKQFGGTTYTDILNVFATNVDRFISNALDNSKQFKTATVSIDEPSIGINPQIMFSDEDLIGALEKAGRTAASKKVDTEIHLHSPLNYGLICETSSINTIGVESAANPSYLNLIDREDLKTYDKFLRVGVARTDISNMSAFLNEKYGFNVWKEPLKLEDIVTSMESPQVIEMRLEKAYSMFGDRIKYAGPDCGLGSWPSQGLAFRLLKNAGRGIKEFQKKKR